MIRLLPAQMENIIKSNLLTGLRPTEAVKAVMLINDKEASAKYYEPDQQTLCHCKFPQFLRITKKAFVSYATQEMLALVQNLS